MAARGHGRIWRGDRARSGRQEALLHAVRETQRACTGKGCILEAVPRSSPSSSFHPDAKDMLASSLAREILAADSERAKLFSKLGRLLQDDKTYRCLFTILGIGPKSASALATSFFLRDSKLAAYCGPQTTTADPPSGAKERP